MDDLKECCDAFVAGLQPRKPLPGLRFPEWHQCPTCTLSLKVVFECGELLGGETVCAAVAVEDAKPGTR